MRELGVAALLAILAAVLIEGFYPGTMGPFLARAGTGLRQPAENLLEWSVRYVAPPLIIFLVLWMMVKKLGGK